jgi:hypothetical protein
MATGGLFLGVGSSGGFDSAVELIPIRIDSSRGSEDFLFFVSCVVGK